jgi:hypothetical protein
MPINSCEWSILELPAVLSFKHNRRLEPGPYSSSRSNLLTPASPSREMFDSLRAANLSLSVFGKAFYS